MFKAEFELEAITPIFMRGADQSQAEIRASSIKGLMRWWFRALAGNYFGSNIASLKKAEEYVFGSTGCRSKVSVEITEIKGEKKSLIFRRSGRSCIIDRYSPTNQLRYLWFSVNLLARNCKFDEYYPDGTMFTIKVSSLDDRSFKIALVSLWALVTLGGIGFRWRRGAGCLKFKSGDLHLLEELSLKWKYNTMNDLRESISIAVSRVGLDLGLKSIEDLEPQSYPILSQKTSFVGLWNAETGNPIEALKRFQNKYQKFRREEIRKKDRIIFGLPMNLRGRDTEDIEDCIPKIRDCRRASPMIVGLIHIGGKLYVRLVKFKTKPYHPDNDLDVLSNWKILDKFNISLKELQVFGSLEVFE